MADHRAPSVEEDIQSSVGTLVESLQSDREAEKTEQATDLTINGQRPSFGLLCAANHTWGQCLKPAVIPCQICHLVAYCTEECMKADAEYHSRQCPPSTEPPPRPKSTSEFPDCHVRDDTSFWAKHAATDVLNLGENEGKEYNGLLRVLLTGTFGLRHLIYSVVAMPETASPSLEVTISETDLPHLYRTFLSLLILWKGMDINKDPYEVADLVTQVWYSYRWPHYVLEILEQDLGQEVEELFKKVKEAIPTGLRVKTDCFKATWETNKLRLEAGFNWSYWEAILNYLIPKKRCEIKQFREFDLTRYGEPYDTAFARRSPSRVEGLVKWWRTGLMLAYGDSPLSHGYLNPMFLTPTSKTPIGFTNEPLSEWPMNEILDYAPYAAKEDVYGKMVAYVREMLVKFQLRLKKQALFVRLMSAGSVTMAGYLAANCEKQPKFDRIEAGSLFDINPELCFLSFSPLLRHEDENPFATLLIMTRESVTKSESLQLKELIAAEKNKLFQPVSESLDSIAPPVQSAGNKYSVDCVHRHFALQVFDRNWDMFSDRYLADASLFGFEFSENSEPKRSIFQTGWLGLKYKQKNSVKARWPNRLVYTNGKILTEEDASRLRRWKSWPTTKPERWLEWKKVKDITWAEWSMYYEMVKEGKDYEIKDLEKMFHFVAKEEMFLWRERQYEDCHCGCGVRLFTSENEHEQEPAILIERRSTLATEEEAEDDSWMKMDPAEDSSAAAGQAGMSKKPKKKKKRKAGRR